MSHHHNLSAQAIELARARRIVIASGEEEERPRRAIPYERAEVFLRDGVILDPERKVLNAWEKTDFDACKIITEKIVDGKKVYDVGFGVGVYEGKFKVRVLRRPETGAVKEVDLPAYLEIRAQNSGSRALCPPQFEPVPKDTPLRGPILPPNFPTDMNKARRMAGNGLGINPDKITFPEMLKFFEKGSPRHEVAK